ncbi:MAG: hypothetical protein ACK4M7_06300, partial [Burkholderiales bacterium]
IASEFHYEFEHVWLSSAPSLMASGKLQDKSIKNHVVGYLSSLKQEQLLTLATYLCYPSNGVDETGISYLLHKKMVSSENDTQQRIRKLKFIIELCNQLASRLLDYQIDQVNTIYSNQQGLEKSFINILHQVKQMAKNLLKVFFPNENVLYVAENITRIVNDTPAENWQDGVLKAEIAGEILQDLTRIEQLLKYLQLNNSITESSKRNVLAIKGEIMLIRESLCNNDPNNRLTREDTQRVVRDKVSQILNLASLIPEIRSKSPEKLKLPLIKHELDHLSKQISNFNRIVKGGGTLDPEANLAKGTTISIPFGDFFTSAVLYNTASEAPAISKILTSSTPGATGLNLLWEAIAGIFAAWNRKEQLGLDLMVKQSIGLYKNHVLDLIKGYYDLGGVLSEADKKAFHKFFSIKRGDFFGNKSTLIFELNQTKSLSEFNRISAGRFRSTKEQLKFELGRKSTSFINLKAELKRLVVERDYEGIKNILTYLKETNTDKNKIAQITFYITYHTRSRMYGVRGNLLAQLLNAHELDLNNSLLTECLDLTIQLTENSSKLFELAKNCDYTALRIHLMESYEVKNKYDFLNDWQ